MGVLMIALWLALAIDRWLGEKTGMDCSLRNNDEEDRQMPNPQRRLTDFTSLHPIHYFDSWPRSHIKVFRHFSS